MSENQRPQMAAAVLYFIGRVAGAAPNLDLTAEIRRIVPTLSPLNLGDEAKRCAAIFTEKGAKLQAVGKALQEKARPRALNRADHAGAAERFASSAVAAVWRRLFSSEILNWARCCPMERR